NRTSNGCVFITLILSSKPTYVFTLITSIIVRKSLKSVKFSLKSNGHYQERNVLSYAIRT
ncbi:hypothetical protein, partial [Enterococcus hirae]|uniref:hypothetical protein n=1 Tax=Enterococcus hirae TaxID=1354 RepID=UPI003CFB5319